MILYKYTTYHNCLKILLQKSIRYTQPICFNDPFELYPIIEEYFNNEQFEEMLDVVTQEPFLEQNYQTVLRDHYDNLSDDIKSLIKYEVFYPIQKRIIEDELKKRNLPIKQLIKESLNAGTVDIHAMMNVEYLKIINSIMGILSLSKINNDILMWSHYADAHTGVVLKIDSDNSFFEKLGEVNYPEDNERPKIKLSNRDYSSKDSISLYKKVFYSKSIDWKYESEVRDMKPLLNAHNSTEKDKSGMPIFLFDFPPEIIKGVIFGLRVDLEMISDFIKQITPIYGMLEYDKINLDPHKYDFVINKIEVAV
ncbi:MAG: DUF2971 domain-containing protein [Melioribacteraceae bacterium]|nr:DUF2971 domain-containing protein [Melioribacteraceae bacterium]